jgi:tellurite resistance protein
MDGPVDLKDRGKALEEAFFRREGDRLREQLRLQEEEAAAREALAEASGISDEALLARLAALGIRAETLAALTLVPLVEVAWADGRMEPRERDAVLRGAESSGIESGSPSHGLLRLWTEDRPAPELMRSWKAYIRALTAELSADQKWHLEERLLGRARAVAEAAGGFLGLGSKVSAEEEAVLKQLEEAFGAPSSS